MIFVLYNLSLDIFAKLNKFIKFYFFGFNNPNTTNFCFYTKNQLNLLFYIFHQKSFFIGYLTLAEQVAS